MRMIQHPTSHLLQQLWWKFCNSSHLWKRLLHELCIRASSSHWISRCLSERTQKVYVKSRKSNPKDTRIGHNLFILCGNAIFSIIHDQNSSLILFADDVNLPIRSNSIPEAMEKAKIMLDMLSSWFCANSLRLSVSKMIFMILSKCCEDLSNVPQNIKTDHLCLADRVRQFKLLGVFIKKIILN